ncbi:unnamed protein product [Brassica rapa subsp. narinosa]
MQEPHAPRGSRQTGDTSPPHAATGDNRKGRTTTNPRTHHALPLETAREHKEEQRSLRYPQIYKRQAQTLVPNHSCSDQTPRAYKSFLFRPNSCVVLVSRN